ncbi:type II secretion system F family protein [Micromonospora sp. NBC_01813]|uniref:type II secretion system F family protein n=1 Tax=Micromonospora sp. NBC_01813 TaxID=2975988 RepID=UPI002DDAA687|nr:type II secretion system F family protein [Micromonospora sp. NBC_01813]WSA12803.1 type II secretion system F family protein [Micromonospora sp. NBC_01813]
MLNWQLTIAVVGGALFGLGVFLLIRETSPATPALAPALRRLHQAQQRPSAVGTGGGELQWLTGVTRWLRPPHKELALLGRTPEQYALSLLLSALIGLAAPPVATIGLAAVGIELPLVLPVLAGLALAAGGALIAHQDVVSKASQARREFSRAVCTYLDLVALQMAAAHGPVQALERAAKVCDGWVFDRIREALRLAQLQMHSPWDELRDLSDQIGVPELGDVGSIMQSSGTEGAQVHETLRSRADSLRDQIRTDNLARAEAVTGRLDIPGAFLVFVLIGFVLYPFLARI